MILKEVTMNKKCDFIKTQINVQPPILAYSKFHSKDSQKLNTAETEALKGFESDIGAYIRSCNNMDNVSHHYFYKFLSHFKKDAEAYNHLNTKGQSFIDNIYSMKDVECVAKILDCVVSLE